jgi:hypothetical protein
VVVSWIGEFFRELAEMLVRDGLVETGKWMFHRRKPEQVSAERAKIVAKRDKDRRNRHCGYYDFMVIPPA